MKAHITDSVDPLREGETLTANCGAEIANAYFVFYVDTSAGIGAQLNSLMTCKSCRETMSGKRYIYGIVPGQEARTA